MSALATRQMPGNNATDLTNVSDSPQPAKQRCRGYLKRGKNSAARRLHSLKQRVKIGLRTSHLDESSKKAIEPATVSGAIASDPATVPDFSELDGTKLGELDGSCLSGCLEGVGDVLKGLLCCVLCLIECGVGCVCCVLGGAVGCLCCPLGIVINLAVD